jgi:cysteine desulfuration protein SufE
MEIKNRLDKLIEEFSRINEWEDRYKKIIEIGKGLPPIKEEERIPGNIIKGCQSQVWLISEFIDGKIYFRADSDATIVKGIVALLVNIYSNSTPDEILNTRPDFIEKIGLKEHLSMSRANGLSSMIKQITIYAMAYKAKSQL